jgi:hypothetical protein
MALVCGVCEVGPKNVVALRFKRVPLRPRAVIQIHWRFFPTPTVAPDGTPQKIPENRGQSPENQCEAAAGLGETECSPKGQKVLAMSIVRPLFGGAMGVALPARFQDIRYVFRGEFGLP